ncbi:unnamed protein product [Protopolystoma xenopodis]|uniref:Uncharacterized protein n=1 Tax=Protopolystoma xenopodis TaxID=117903 RepID=A0A3S5AEV2_9PLAT|nr:unnamed protein product [Protopolystoma xenopodis]
MHAFELSHASGRTGTRDTHAHNQRDPARGPDAQVHRRPGAHETAAGGAPQRDEATPVLTPPRLHHRFTPQPEALINCCLIISTRSRNTHTLLHVLPRRLKPTRNCTPSRLVGQL